MKVTMSGEGDFEIEAEDAWHIEALAEGHRLVLTERDGLQVLVDDVVVWRAGERTE